MAFVGCPRFSRPTGSLWDLAFCVFRGFSFCHTCCLAASQKLTPVKEASSPYSDRDTISEMIVNAFASNGCERLLPPLPSAGVFFFLFIYGPCGGLAPFPSLPACIYFVRCSIHLNLIKSIVRVHHYCVQSICKSLGREGTQPLILN